MAAAAHNMAAAAHSMAAAAEHMLTPFMAGCRRIRQFASEHCLTDRPHSMLWLAKGYALAASMYASQIWGTRYMKQGAEMDCPLQTVHMCSLKGILGAKRTTLNWSVLRECGQEPLLFYWFRAAVRFYNALSIMLFAVIVARLPRSSRLILQ